ncbi:MAG: hypothetical protein WC120_00855 [Parcubacteria group bacterium]
MSKQESFLCSIGFEHIIGACDEARFNEVSSIMPAKITPRIIRGVEMAVEVLGSGVTFDLSGNELGCNFDRDDENAKIVVEMVKSLEQKNQLLVSMAFFILDCYAMIVIGAHESGIEMPSAYEGIIEKIPYHRLTPLNKERRRCLSSIKEDEQYLFPWYVFFSSEEYDEKKVTIPELSAWYADATADKDFLSYWSLG